MSNHYVRRVFPDSVVWVPRKYWDSPDGNSSFAFVVQRYPFVPDYHVTFLGYDPEDESTEDIMSTHKTLAEAVSILNVLLANGGMYA
jgi:hypothetical protein